MSKKTAVALAIFKILMAVIYIGLGIFYLTTDYGVMVERKIGKWPGYLLILFGLYRAFGAYQQIKSYRESDE